MHCLTHIQILRTFNNKIVHFTLTETFNLNERTPGIFKSMSGIHPPTGRSSTYLQPYNRAIEE